MSGRFPGGANSLEVFWDVLRKGLDVHEEVPPLHWSMAHVDPTGTRKNTGATPYGCWLSDPASWDAKFFNISPREAPQIDPAQRLALLTAYEALEQAGVVPDATPSTRRDRVGVFYGVTSNDWMETNSAQNIDTYFIPGGNRAFIPGRINYHFKFSGPSYATDTACSSSLAAIHTAINSLWQHDIDMAIAGGTNVLTNPDFTAGLDRGHFLSRTGNCKTFDDGADGYCRGEGIGTIVLKRLDDAIAEKDPILGVILGAYTNHSAEAESITRPHSGAQQAIFSKILNSSAVEPDTIGYVEMHGTGTQAGDNTEMTSVLSTFAPEGKPTRQTPVYLGSAKSNIGHGEAASGVSSLIKVILMMKNNMIPPHVGIKTKINRKFPTDLAERNVRIAKDLEPWDAGSEPRRAFVNNFSAAGGNSALLLEEAPIPKLRSAEDNAAHADGLIVVSAKTSSSFGGNLLALKRYLESSKDTTFLSQLSYTTTARRMHHQHRALLVGSSVDEVITQVDIAVREQTRFTRTKSKTPKTVFAFTGQGSQFPGMGRRMMETFALFRTELRQLDHLSCNLGFASILPVYLAAQEDSLDRFTPVQVQLASTCMQIALARLWASWGIAPEAVVGHSLGEYAALNVAGVLSDSDTIYLVGTRATLLQNLCTPGTHSMLVVRAPAASVTAILKSTPQIACINSPIETVLAGPDEQIARAAKTLGDAGVKTTKLGTPFAFHSSQVEPVLAPFQEAAVSVRFNAPRCPVLCPLNGNLITDEGTFNPAYLARHCREPVNLLQALQTAREHKIMTDDTILLEVGPHPAVSGMVKATLGQQMKVVSAINRKSVRNVLADALKVVYEAGADINWTTYHNDFPASQQVIADLPAYSWDLKPYWIQYKNDWSLRKGDAAIDIESVEGKAAHRPPLESTTIHRVLEETISNGGTSEHIVVEADISRPDLNPLVQGHVVDSVPLCTPSVYADMALTLGYYLVERRQHPNTQVDVSNMSIFKALIAKAKGPQPLQAQADVNWAKEEATLKFVSFDAKGKPQEHAKCTLRFVERSVLLNKLKKEAKGKQNRMQSLREGIAKHTSTRFNRPMAYRMIRPLAQFHDDYKAIDEIVLDSNTLEASAAVSFGGIGSKDGNFGLHPAIIDAFTQSCGFTMNCNDHTDLDKEVYMNHGWGRFQVFENVHHDRSYTSYTKMVEGKDKIWHGDVVIFDGETIVAAFEKIEIQCVPRRVLQAILSIESGSGAKKQAPVKASSTVKVVETPNTVKVTETHFKEVPAPETALKVWSTSADVALQIISEESGVPLPELTENSAFADIGVDSLLGLSITARFREELDVELDFDSVLTTCPTIGDLKRFLLPAAVVQTKEVRLQQTLFATSAPASPAKVIEDIVELSVSRGDDTNVDFRRVLGIISEESGIAVDELTDDAHFADTGIDSLLGLVIGSRFREELGLDADMDSVFVDCQTIADLRSYLGDNSSSSESNDLLVVETISKPKSILDGKPFGTTIAVRPIDITPPPSEDSSDIESYDGNPRHVEVPRATSLVLQGAPTFATKTLFLFPDGAGSASSYAQVPNLGINTCVVALNCPFLKDPQSLRNARLDDIILQGYLAEIRRRQPLGPYYLGGWSAGGILAYRAAQILLEQGDEVHSLSLIDSPPPLRGLDRLPPHFYQYCEKLHLFGHKSASNPSAGPPAWLIPHFNSTIDLLHEYCAAPMQQSMPLPNVHILWAATSISDNPRLPKLPPHPDDTEGMKFLLERRTDFGGNGWESLFPAGHKVVIDRVEGAHHFSMMREPYSQKLADFLREAIA